MADIRINALATTAASTASDDFVAVDGSANGTRKLNAYSPTFGGNLTVSGNSVFSGYNQFGNDITPYSSATKLTVGGTSASAGIEIGQSATRKAFLYWNYNATAADARMIIDTYGGSNPLCFQTAGGNVLIGTTVDSSALLQVGTNTTTAAGGMKFGTDISLFRAGNSILTLNTTSDDAQFRLSKNGTVGGQIVTNSTNVYWDTASAHILRTGSATGGTTALTLDSSQNATFAGNVTLSNSGNAFFNLRYGSGGFGMVEFTRNSVNKGRIYQNSSDELFIESATANQAIKLVGTDATFAGAIAIGNTVNTVSPTSPNRTITMVIGGTTYYIHAKTTND